MQTALTSDLVRDSKLDASVNGDVTRHVIEVAGRTARQRKVRQEQLWERVENLGEGAYGTVWLEKLVSGECSVSERAVKIMKKQVQKSKTIDYSRELEAIAKFSHPKYNACFVESFGWFESDRHVHIAMEYFPLGDLQAYLTSPLPETEVKQICFQILEGLDFMHRNGFAHRDLKPANILVKSHSPDWWVKIGDFGISKRAGEGLHALRTLSGTLGFMAPEVLVQHGLLDSAEFGEVREYTVAVDIWSLGEIIFRALTNEPPFPKGLASYIKEPSSYPFEVIDKLNIHWNAGKFVWNLLRPMPADRPTAAVALRHPWLASLQKPLPAAESTGSLQKSMLDLNIKPSSPSGAAQSATEDRPLSIASAIWSTIRTGGEQIHNAVMGPGIPSASPSATIVPKQPQAVETNTGDIDGVHSSEVNVSRADDSKVETEPIGRTWRRYMFPPKYDDEIYITHLRLEEGRELLLTYNYIVMIKYVASNIEWEVQMKDVKIITKEKSGIEIQLRSDKEGPKIAIEDRSKRDGLWTKIAVAVQAYNEMNYLNSNKK